MGSASHSIEPEVITAKSILALVVAVAALLATAMYGARRHSLSILLFAAACCFTVVALAHVFEAFDLVSAAGWGRPNSVGHYIDLSAAVLSGAFTLSALVLIIRRRWLS